MIILNHIVDTSLEMEGPLRDGFALNYHLFHSAFDATFWVDVCSRFELPSFLSASWWLRLLGAGLQVVWLEEFVLPISFCDAITQIICLN